MLSNASNDEPCYATNKKLHIQSMGHHAKWEAP